MDIDPIRPNTLTELAAVEQERCVSLMMPTHATGKETRQDPIRLSNLLNQLQEQLAGEGMRRPDIEKLLQPARDVVQNSSFWQFQGASLAVYLAEGVGHMLRLPEPVDESITIGPRFNIKALLGSVASSDPFYVLALTKQQARLFLGTRNSLEELQTEGFPLGATEVVGVRDAEPELQHHSGAAPRGGRGDRGQRSDMGQAMYHGHGDGEMKVEADTLHFIKEVADRVGNYLYGDDAPLVLAADISLVGVYHREHVRGNLVESEHVESPDALKPHEIREQAWKIAAPALEADISALLNRFGTADSAGRAAQGYGDVAKAAAQGKVEILFFDPRAAQLGWLTDGGTTAHLANTSEADQGEEGPAEDLLNRAIIDTLKASGRAIPLAGVRGRNSRDAEPQPPKAILRY